MDSAFWGYFAFKSNREITVGISCHFFGQPVYSQLLKSLDRGKIIENKPQIRRREVCKEL